MRFLVITHVQHLEKDQKFYAYSPYVREINIWLQQVNTLEVIAPLGNYKMASNDLAYHHPNIIFKKIPSFNFLSPIEAIQALLKIPLIILKICAAMKRADHVHIRCPGNVGLLGCICQIFFPEKPKTAKYAGNWDPKAKQPWTYKLQRWILSNTFLTKKMTVLVYGEWPGQSKNVKPFFTASFSEKSILKVQEKGFQEPWLFLFVGNLVQGKGLQKALELVQELQENEVACKMEIYGEGPEKEAAKAYVEEAGIKCIQFKGNRILEELEDAYQKGHFIILPSKSEGWPKAVAEGMFFGCIPLVTDISCVRWMLGDGKRGLIYLTKSHRGSAEETEENVERILELLGDRERMQQMSKEAKKWSQQYTIERFEKGIIKVLVSDSKS